jgi:ATP-dependent DNA helicase RecG
VVEGSSAAIDLSGAPVLPDGTPLRRLAMTLAAVANARGGTVWLGRESLADEAALGTARDRVAQAALACEPPLGGLAVRAVERDGRTMLAVEIPVGLPYVYSVSGRYWVRQSGRNRPLGGRLLQQLILERGAADSTSAAFEALPAPNAMLEDLDWDRVRAYLTRGSSSEAGAPSPPAANIDSLSAPALARELSRVAGGLILQGDHARPTFAGLLLFGLAPQQFLPSSEITLVRYAGPQMADEFIREELRGTLPEQIQRAEAFLANNMRRGHRLSGWQRDEQTEYPLEAVREAVVNAVAHRDYSVRGEGIRVLMFADRLEVYSPGRLPGHVTLENLVDERFSRNWVIVQLLSDLGFIERLGYGIDRMIAAMEAAGLPKPTFSETANGFKVVLYGQGERLITVGPDPSRWSHLNVNERQRKVLAFLTESDRVTNRLYQELCPDVSAETIRRDLAELVDLGLLLKIGDKRATYYILK